MTYLGGADRRLSWMAGIARWPVLLAAIITTVAAIGFGIAAATATVTVLGQGPIGVPVTIASEPPPGVRLDIYGRGQFVDENWKCVLSGDGSVFSDNGHKRRTFEGQSWVRLGRTGGGEQSGETVTCTATGVDVIRVVQDPGALWRIYAIALSVGSLFLLWPFAIVLGFMARSRP